MIRTLAQSTLVSLLPARGGEKVAEGRMRGMTLQIRPADSDRGSGKDARVCDAFGVGVYQGARIPVVACGDAPATVCDAFGVAT